MPSEPPPHGPACSIHTVRRGLRLRSPGSPTAGALLATVLVALQVLVPARGVSQSSCDAPTHSIVELPGASEALTQARAINVKHEVVGFSVGADSISYALRWPTTVGRRILSPASSAGAFGISDSGLVAGSISTALGDRAALWTPGGRLQWLAPLRGDESSTAFAVNSSGTTVGASLNTNGEPSAVLWHSQHAATALPSDGAKRSLALAINDAGLIVGQGEYDDPPVQRALLWSHRVLTRLPGLGGNVDAAEAIASGGTFIAGTSLDPKTGQPHAVLWRDGHIEDLGAAQPRQASAAHGVNRHGAAVGEVAIDASGLTVAVLWTQGVATRLDELVAPDEGWTLVSARAINDAGEIVGYGQRRGAPGMRAFLVRALPESAQASARCPRMTSVQWEPRHSR